MSFRDGAAWLSAHGGLAIWIGGLSTLLIGFSTIATQRAINRRRATIDMLMKKIWDKDYLDRCLVYYDVMRQQKKLLEYHDMFLKARDIKRTDKWDELSKEERKQYDVATETIYSVISVLNDRELTAIGIREGTYDDVICRRWWYSTFLNEWRLSSTFIARLRTDTQLGNPAPAAYCEMEALALRWMSEGPWNQSARHVNLPGGRQLVFKRSR